jgi:hypothetical protein
MANPRSVAWVALDELHHVENFPAADVDYAIIKTTAFDAPPA